MTNPVPALVRAFLLVSKIAKNPCPRFVVKFVVEDMYVRLGKLDHVIVVRDSAWKVTE